MPLSVAGALGSRSWDHPATTHLGLGRVTCWWGLKLAPDVTRTCARSLGSEGATRQTDRKPQKLNSP